MEKFEHYFPLGIAKGEAFVGRADKISWLKKNIQAGIHTLLLAPRRYGKSSLVLHTLENSDMIYHEIDLQLCRSAKSVEKKIIHGIEKIIPLSVKKKDSILQRAGSFFKKTHKQWKIGLKGLIELTLEPDRFDDTADNILTAFQFLETILKTENKKIVFFMDEIQEIHQLEESLEIQGAIRHFAQKSTHVVFIFSGSNRRLLTQMFNDKSMPLYQLCDHITLDKIDSEEYIKYFHKVSKKTWGYLISDEVISALMTVSQRHPRRIYHLCLYLWRWVEAHKKIPDASDVLTAWDTLVKSETKNIRFFLSRLNTSQLKLLVYIALNHQTELTGKTAQKTLNLSSTAISKSLQQLEEEDLIVKDDQNTYAIIDPLVRDVLARYESELINPS